MRPRAERSTLAFPPLQRLSSLEYLLATLWRRKHLVAPVLTRLANVRDHGALLRTALAHAAGLCQAFGSSPPAVTLARPVMTK